MSDTEQTNDNTNFFLKQTPVLKSKRGSFTSWKGNKYPEVKLRGFYSDITSHQNADKTGVIIFNIRLFNIKNTI